MTLIEMPGNTGKIFAIDPARVTGLAPYRSTLPGRGGQLFDMTIVWLDNRTLFVCCWTVEHVLSTVNAARQPLESAFRAGYSAGASAGHPHPQDCDKALGEWMAPVQEGRAS